MKRNIQLKKKVRAPRGTRYEAKVGEYQTYHSYLTGCLQECEEYAHLIGCKFANEVSRPESAILNSALSEGDYWRQSFKLEKYCGKNTRKYFHFVITKLARQYELVCYCS